MGIDGGIIKSVKGGEKLKEGYRKGARVPSTLKLALKTMYECGLRKDAVIKTRNTIWSVDIVARLPEDMPKKGERGKIEYLDLCVICKNAEDENIIALAKKYIEEHPYLCERKEKNDENN